MTSTAIVLCEPSELYNILNQSSRYPCLSDPNYLLLLDTRKRNNYNESHIITSKYAPRNDIEAFTVPEDAELETKVHVVVYDSNTNTTKEKGSSALSCAKLMWEMGSKNSVKILKGGYETFSALYPFLRTQKIIYMPRELDVLTTFPLEVLTSFLYIGTYQQSQQREVTKHLKVKAHVNVSMETDKEFSVDTITLGVNDKKVAKSFNIPVEDEGSADLYSYFQDVVNFIDDHNTDNGQSVLIFSNLGISRCVTIAIAYVMWHKKISLKDAYKHLKKCRENMQPTQRFVDQLGKWEKKLFGKTITDTNEPNL